MFLRHPGSHEAELGRLGQVQLGERLGHGVEGAVRGRRGAEEERQDVVVRDVLRTSLEHLSDALGQDDRAVRDRRHADHRRRFAGVGRLGHRGPDARLDVEARAGARLADLLHVGQAEHVDVRHRQPAVGDRPVDPREHQRLVGLVQLEEAVLLAGRVVRPPDGVEAMALPRAQEACQGPERIGSRRERLDRLRRLHLRRGEPREREVRVRLRTCRHDDSLQDQ